MNNKKLLLLNIKKIMAENEKKINKPVLKLFFLRHGNATNNEGITSFDSKLTDLGISQATEMKNILKEYKFNKIYCSSLSRCIQTSHYALNSEDIYLDDRIKEQTFSECEKRMEKAELIKFTKSLKNNKYYFYNVADNYQFKEENKAELRLRVLDFFNYIINTHSNGGKILIISHYSWISCLFKFITGANNEFHNCEIKSIELNF